MATKQWSRGNYTDRWGLREEERNIFSPKTVKLQSRHKRPRKSDSDVSRYIAKSTARSSFVGLSKIATSRTLFGKILWALLTIICVTGFFYQALRFAIVYHDLPTEVSLQVQNDGTVIFPAVTICNNNRIRRSAYCKHYDQDCDPAVKLSEFQIKEAYLRALDNKSMSKSELGHSLAMVRSCIFKDEQRHINSTECLKRFHRLFDPDFGNCFTFSARNEDGTYLTATEADFWESTNDLVVLLDAEAHEQMEERRQIGMIVTIHEDGHFPDLHTDGIQIEEGKFYTFAVQQSETHLLPLPFKTNCTELLSLDWVSKNKLPSPRMCTVGCSSHFQEKNCGYVTSNLSLFYDKLPWDSTKVTEEQIRCASDVETTTKSYCRTLCAVQCRDVQFEISVGKIALQLTELRELGENEEENPDWQNLTAIKVYYKTTERKIYRHIPLYDDQELFSYLGGYSGVWLGFSLLNLFELLEIVATSLYKVWTTKSNNEKKKRKKFCGRRVHPLLKKADRKGCGTLTKRIKKRSTCLCTSCL